MSWGPAKSFAAAALDAGVDLTDPADVERFIHRTTGGHAAAPFESGAQPAGRRLRRHPLAGDGQSSAAGRGAKGVAELGQPCVGHGRDPPGEERLRHGRQVVEAQGALLGHAVRTRERDLGGDATDGPGRGRDEHGIQDPYGGFAGKHAGGPATGVAMLDPPDLAAVHHGSAAIIWRPA